jgi:ABC-type transporter Mla subunit MlaD
MAEETITILRVGTEEAVRSVNDLKENIKVLKQNLGELEIGTEEYQTTLEELKINQNALKDAMYATSSSMEDVAAAATGASKSYNSLVHQMAALKEEWRATNDEARRNELGKQIADINQQLKDMDASVGNFQRNVGNYESGAKGLVAKFDELGGILKQMPPTLGSVKEKMGKVGETMQLVGKQPILGIIGLLAPIIMKITESLKENETAMDAVKRVMESLQPVFDILTGVIEKVAEGLANVVDWFIQFIGQSDGVKNIISAIMGVGNSILQYLLTPIKTAVAAFKGLGNIIKDVFTGNWGDVKKHAKEAGEGIADAWKDGYSFKANFQSGKAAGKEFISGVSDNKEDANAAGEETGAEFVDGVASNANKSKAKDAGKELAKSVQEGFDEWEDEQRALSEEESFTEEYQSEIDAADAFQKELNDNLWNRLIEKADMQDEFREREEESEKEHANILKEINWANAQEKIKSLFAISDATSSVLGSIADMYETDEKNAEKNAQKIKALRIAEATINTISGAIGAFMGITKDTGGWGIAAATAEAAAVLAAGMAQIKQIRQTKVSSSETMSAIPASVDAPQVQTSIPSVRNVTSATEEDRLNRMSKEQRVYIVSSDIEAALEDSRTRVAESSF